MRVVIVSCVYPPEPVVSAQMSHALAVGLSATGAQVKVVCPTPSRPCGSNFDESRPPEVPGVEVVRVRSFTAPRSSMLSRLLESWSFGRHVRDHLAYDGERVDVIYANTWPLLSQAYLARFCVKMGIPLVMHVQDVYPEAGLGKLSSPIRGLLAWPLLALDCWTVRQATRVVLISEGMRKSYAASRGIPPEKVQVILNWTDETRFTPSLDRAATYTRFGIPPERFTFLYVGTVNHTANVELLIEAFRLAGISGAQLVIAGDGSTRADCMRRVQEIGLEHVHFLTGITAENTPLVQSIGDVCLLPLRRGVGVNGMPSKLMAYMLSAKPILATVDTDSDTAQCINEADCGWVGEPENEEWLSMQMRKVALMTKSERESFGKRGSAYAMKHFSKSEGVEKLGEVILAAANSHKKDRCGINGE